VGETATSSGVRAGDWFFPGYPRPGGGPQERFAFYAVPYDMDDIATLRLEASDSVGNRAEARFVDRFFPRKLGTDTIGLSDRFLERVVPAIISQTPELASSGDALQDYLTINGELRVSNRAELRELAARSTPEFLWRGPFLSHRNAQAMAGFAERRTYLYEGKRVDTQVHLGFDLASTARSPVQAAAGGIVLRAGWFGIYGNAVVVDHGYGLMTLYGHMSTVDVAEGEPVTRGQALGRTGATGLAGGDHLHFAVLLQGLPVNPREWWDGHWIHDRLRLKLGEALPAEE
jgi:murein DD-endopeptidase MepM/ murein hydrolase activator NlpD